MPEVTDDGRYLVITIGVGTDERYRVVVKDLGEPLAMPLDLVDRFEHDFTLAGSDGPVLYFRTNLDAPRRRVIAIDLRRPQRQHWKEVVPQAEATLEQVSLVGNLLVASYLKDVLPQVKLFTLDGRLVREVQFPGIGSARGFGGRRSDTETFYSFSSFATPPSIYRYDLLTGGKPAAPPRRGQVPPRGLRGPASLLPQQGWHAGAHVPGLPQGAEA